MSKLKYEIVVPLDGSVLAEQVIPVAEALRDRSGQLIFLEVVFPTGPERSLFGEIEITSDEMLDLKKESAERRLEETAERWGSVLRRKPKILAESGDTVETILRVATEEEAQFIAIASSGKGALARLAFGSVADQLTRSSRWPLLIIHPDREREGEVDPVEFARIVVPLDGSELAEEAVPIAAGLAERAGAAMLLVQVIDPTIPVAYVAPSAPPITAELYDQVTAAMEDGARESLDRAERLLGGQPITIDQRVVQAATVPGIASVVRAGDLIVMTSHGRSGFHRWMLGSVTQRIIKERIAPVVLVPSSTRAQASAKK